jgi:glutamate/tyrosine decarboxylase-like PLP-dependent enzyme
MWAGIELADSVVVNVHKWLGVPFDCSLYYVRDTQHLMRVMSTNPSYLQTTVDAEVKSLRDWGIPLGRRFRALKLWFVIRDFGVEGLRSLVREHIRIAKSLARWIDEDPNLERLAEVNFSTVIFRHCPAGLSPEELNQHNVRVLERVNSTREVYLSHTRVRGRYALRVAIGNIHTTEAHVRRAFELVKEAGTQK